VKFDRIGCYSGGSDLIGALIKSELIATFISRKSPRKINPPVYKMSLNLTRWPRERVKIFLFTLCGK